MISVLHGALDKNAGSELAAKQEMAMAAVVDLSKKLEALIKESKREGYEKSKYKLEAQILVLPKELAKSIAIGHENASILTQKAVKMAINLAIGCLAGLVPEKLAAQYQNTLEAALSCQLPQEHKAQCVPTKSILERIQAVLSPDNVETKFLLSIGKILLEQYNQKNANTLREELKRVTLTFFRDFLRKQGKKWLAQACSCAGLTNAQSTYVASAVSHFGFNACPVVKKGLKEIWSTGFVQEKLKQEKCTLQNRGKKAVTTAVAYGMFLTNLLTRVQVMEDSIKALHWVATPAVR